MTPSARRSNTRLLLVGVFLGALLLVLAGRAVELMVLRGPALASAAEANRTRVVPDPAPRGLILDSSGRPLVANTAAAGVLIDKAALADQADGGAAVLARTATAVGLSERALRARLTPCGSAGAAPRPVCDDTSAQSAVFVPAASRDDVLPLAETPGDYPGITVTSAVQRSYPQDGVTAGHLLGYLGAVSADDLARDPGLTAADLMGRGGLEQQYDAALRGTAGERHLLVTARGDVEGTEQTRPAAPGLNLVTSLDSRVQAAVDQALTNALAYAGDPQARAGAAVLDVRTGRVLALGSKPDYAPQQWVGGISDRAYRALSDSGALVDYATSGTAPPGSAFKPISVLAMARSGTPLTGSFDCPSTYTAGGRTFTNHESQAYGTLSLPQALAVSCNTVFYRAADRLWRSGGGEAQGAGVLDPIAQAATDLGLGSRTGIDLPGEQPGLVASPAAKERLWQERRDAWCRAAAEGYPQLRATDPIQADYYTRLDRENCRSGQLWREGDAINAGIGQGLTATTPLQLAVAYAAIGNGGTVWQPSIARALVGADGVATQQFAPRVRAQLPAADAATLRFLRRALVGVPRSGGTAAAAFAGFPLDEFPVAGKTGSAQVEGQNSTAWFASLAPADDPRYAVVVMVTRGGAGGETAAPAARHIYETLFGVGQRAAFGPGGPPADIPGVAGARS